MPEPDENNNNLDVDSDGIINISEDVIVELVRKTIQGIAHIQTAAKLSSKFGLGRKGGDGIKVSVEKEKGEGGARVLVIDVYVLVKYGRRIPDLAWDVQEKIKLNLERYTGYSVKAVNVNVQGIYIDEQQQTEDLSLDSSGEASS
ncbi:MAG: Asp23/Gls24 family envelope stress response protein [Synergistaceae bacterium]|nr:Asp23/Gls24 family envelope stress response protein [Synergistaceae bacterium]MBQ4418228.1 Asp23/Gls24 family envelope stress response protein [Synergistaceae bacterium]MBQ7569333.1 Asp23/Gls24 family envelope stress response protein [Synergistaceae bacterium]MBQ9582645.1 Asp23/Gls24 family envelope stress response protein [Synergistaceae bacterium]MBQ9896101.1 Asp23/Gls24 family envelope stress response protein [Synergistaceae bacterium]